MGQRGREGGADGFLQGVRDAVPVRSDGDRRPGGHIIRQARCLYGCQRPSGNRGRGCPHNQTEGPEGDIRRRQRFTRRPCGT
ncbi:hypothetical protein SDC9_163625 [bioreactor metagenome]|uniref:Uncharacterized protein n=1 Tax=bioreactor metagenome TaxID=1076179 RepID=A0A645FPD2_9ZZZZ